MNSDNKPKKPGFENLRIWHKAYELMLEIHAICKTLPKDERFRLRDQAERSSSSVVDNLAEAQATYYYNDKIKAAYTARRETGETQSHLRKMEGFKYISPSRANLLILRYEELIRGINAFVNYIARKRELNKNNKNLR
ncbi:MAG: four helix bundle protein [Candidatus Levybacteria bacterium]|nr:four helix bundle protein [Candidatus Levybacteria bacterium]MBI2190308.1 four helix bundle protein [Candidatus Levybacteria bacterium]